MRTLIAPGRHRAGYWVALGATTLVLTAVFVLPLVWVVLSAMKPAAELARVPPTVLPRTWVPQTYAEAWQLMDLGRYFLNTVVVAVGAWAVQLAVDVPAAYALSRLKPVLGRGILAMMLLTLMLPAAVLLLPTYLTIADLGLINSPAAIWLPAAANAFNIYLLKRFFDQLPRELLEAARIDGASQLTLLWRVVLPLSRPILAVVSIFAVVAAWKDFLWPLLVFPDPARQTLSVALQRFAPDTPVNVLLAALVLASAPMVALFLLFQRHVLAGLTTGAVKG
ncbi:multiple sugar transport system permease protein [Saccharothrix coeruleofusca]|uniref:carbohydrate ABC transporter permease n=1 Tax=Saccharothrix coeruleofusca TaxID=33919 RepID=UPI0027DB3B10|nr:carbohydrate ABC transporter permease [Saccharothrix coeruleofusca]MBP2337908.1 multiple sugar transport system permease protein [Saccharothrix coeruleofusca]